MTSNVRPHRGQTICWIPTERLDVLRTGNESPYGHSMKVMSPAIVMTPGRQKQRPVRSAAVFGPKVTIAIRWRANKLPWLPSLVGRWRMDLRRQIDLLHQADYLVEPTVEDPAAAGAGAAGLSRTRMGSRGNEKFPPASSITLTWQV